jgi:TonB family protein
VWLVVRHERVMTVTPLPAVKTKSATRVSLYGRTRPALLAAAEPAEELPRPPPRRKVPVPRAHTEEGDPQRAAPSPAVPRAADEGAEEGAPPPGIESPDEGAPHGVVGEYGYGVTQPARAVPAFDAAAMHARLAASAQRCYPAAARRFSLTGEAQIEFCLDDQGRLSSTKLTHSAGQALLDDAARDCVVVGALPFPAEAAGGCYSVPVRFAP